MFTKILSKNFITNFDIFSQRFYFYYSSKESSLRPLTPDGDVTVTNNPTKENGINGISNGTNGNNKNDSTEDPNLDPNPLNPGMDLVYSKKSEIEFEMILLYSKIISHDFFVKLKTQF